MFYLDLFKELNEADVRYLVVGGLAMNLHGVPRMTIEHLRRLLEKKDEQ